MSIQEIFISENDNLIYKLIDLGIDFKTKEKDLRKISEKIYNNQIGYIQFKDNKENLYKIYILPKIIKTPSNDKEKKAVKEKFFNYMYFSFELIEKYKNLNIKEFKHIEPFLDYFKSEKVSFTDFEHMLYLKYELALKHVFKYFQKHKAYILEEKAYYSQTLKHQLDLRKNIKEMNKAKIHQKRKEVLIYSELAHISYQILNFFDKKILNNFNPAIQAKLSHKVISVKSLLKRKYKTHSPKKAKLKEIISHRIKNLFKKPEDKKLYSYLLTLLGTEITENKEKSLYLMPELLTFFVSPEKIYEVFVYDFYKEKHKKHKIEYQVSKDYKIQTKEGTKELKSIPDIVIYKGNTIIIIDTKWKILKGIDDIKNEDILKLERDTKVWSVGQNKIIPLLIYPVINVKTKELNLIYSEKNNFKFHIRKINIK